MVVHTICGLKESFLISKNNVFNVVYDAESVFFPPKFISWLKIRALIDRTKSIDLAK